MKAGRGYEQAVADVVQAMDPGVTVTQGAWVTGPDGRRELDVAVTGEVDGVKRHVLIECKDYGPRPNGRGPVGIELVDALESKGHDLGFDGCVLCCNAGFTEGAVRKAARVGIRLVAVVMEGDQRVRIEVPEVAYVRQLAINTLQLELWRGGSRIAPDWGVFEAPKYHGMPVGNWVVRRAIEFLTKNPVVNGEYLVTQELVEPIQIDLPAASELVDRIDLLMDISGAWFEHDVTLKASAALYDWLRHRMTPAPGSEFGLRGLEFYGGTVVTRPPDHILTPAEFRTGEVELSWTMIKNFDEPPQPVPDLDQYVKPDDLDLVIRAALPDACHESDSAFERATPPD
jgi:hypothetical protein